MEDHEVHPELALDLVRKLRKRGGRWRLWQTGLLVGMPMYLAASIAAVSPIGIVLTGAGTALLVRNLVQNSRAIRAQQFSNAVHALGEPRVATMDGRLLRIGKQGMSTRQAPALRISAREDRELRQLALPAARVVKRDARDDND